jgi:predicted O-methyltransferase YrrM
VVGFARRHAESKLAGISLSAARVLAPRHRILSGTGDEYLGACLQALGREPQNSYSRYASELLEDVPLREQYERAVAEGVLSRKYATHEQRVTGSIANVVHCYALHREIKPSVVVETGTFHGSMTALVVAALARNGSGKLISIDLPGAELESGMAHRISRLETGYLIPETYRNRWDLRLGDAKDLLPAVLREQPVDIFIHDSLHTREHMAFEYAAAREGMRPGTVIMSDDILASTAWFEMCAETGARGLGHVSNPNLGFCINTK